MPTPIEVLMDPVSLVILVSYAAIAGWEAVAPSRPLPRIPGARLRGMASFGVFFFLSTYLPLLWDGYLASFQLLDLSGLGVVGGALVGLLVYELGAYGYHRFIHSSDPLFTAVHQMHHSTEALDTFSAYYFGPLDMVGWTALGSFCLTLLVGLDPTAVTLVIVATSLLAIFQHANVRTPRWLGYLVQRPESHTVHHARGLHAKNYSDLPLWDILFGTFENPPGYEHETGYYDGASARVLDMVLCRDVTAPPVASAQARAERSSSTAGLSRAA